MRRLVIALPLVDAASSLIILGEGAGGGCLSVGWSVFVVFFALWGWPTDPAKTRGVFLPIFSRKQITLLTTHVTHWRLGKKGVPKLIDIEELKVGA
jgi:hypothetical protein